MIYDANDEFVLDTCGSSLPPHGEYNQKRIVACVNFCKHMDQKDLEWANYLDEQTDNTRRHISFMAANALFNLVRLATGGRP